MAQRCQGTSAYLWVNCLCFPVHTGNQIQSRFGRLCVRALARTFFFFLFLFEQAKCTR
ncbi:hypothetical protein PILCRDRAFT_697931 [Piloderma croceum F 1598]|uniref:Uncharacterized protein n=1 Tax=Piloderma croceum (strain F 1598) TaxID=765440 RepID=A0A0C3F3R0_PILCF|nr:hypothetical protein PILCRDRAFT_697931 [Piloderma croceum F 1598]